MAHQLQVAFLAVLALLGLMVLEEVTVLLELMVKVV
jgi:hypothetical protein